MFLSKAGEHNSEIIVTHSSGVIECVCLGSIVVAGVVFDVQVRHPWPCQVITAGYS